MVLDHDFPMTDLQRRVLVVGLLVMSAIGIALFGGFIPGLKPNYSQPTIDTINGHRYYVEPSLLHIPFLSNSSSPWSVAFHGVSFQLQMTRWSFFTGGIIAGTGTEPNGTTYSFALGHFPNGTRTIWYFSPDNVFGADWSSGSLSVQLLVEVLPSNETSAE
jgi:hypothetical protein